MCSYDYFCNTKHGKYFVVAITPEAVNKKINITL